MQFSYKDYLDNLTVQYVQHVSYIDVIKKNAADSIKDVPPAEEEFGKQCLNLQNYVRGNGRRSAIDSLRFVIKSIDGNVAYYYKGNMPTDVLQKFTYLYELQKQYYYAALRMMVAPQSEALAGSKCPTIIQNVHQQALVDQLNESRILEILGVDIPFFAQKVSEIK